MAILFLLLAIAPSLSFYLAQAVLKRTTDGRAPIGGYFEMAKAGTLFSVLGALIAIIVSINNPPVSESVFVLLSGEAGPLLALGVFTDRVGSIMWVLVGVISFVIVAFSKRYLDGEARQQYFLKWLVITISAVQLVVISSNLAMFLFAWLAVSLSLHRLLTFYSNRPAAMLCAQQKFVVSRVGDLCVLVALVLIARALGTLEFQALPEATSALALRGEGQQLSIAAILVAIGVVAKSAQLPFHAWLPQSLETPTPVSALMHAGIINAGGFLIIRLSSMFSNAHEASALLAIVGGLSALYGMSVMVTQTTIKKRLAYSTIGQMGFMIMQCGLGLYALALLHIVAHGFYKAYAFLRAGSAMDQAREQVFFPARHPYHPIAAAVFVFLVVVGGATGFHLFSEQLITLNYLPILVVWGLAAAHLGWGIVSVRKVSAISIAVGGAFALTLMASYVSISYGMMHYVTSNGDGYPAVSTSVVLLLVVLSGLGFLFQICGKTFTRSRLGRKIHIHIHNGLYFEAFSTRLVRYLRRRTANQN
jgi:NAD(P)H-quinone oxidoreductase subunit 5